MIEATMESCDIAVSRTRSGRVELAGEWELSAADGSVPPVPALLPGDNYTALWRAGAIPDPYLGVNENQVQRVAETDWVFEREFTVPAEFLAKQFVFLNLDSVDTFAEIRINGKPAAVTRNMFTRLRREVKPFLIPGVNRIEVRIASPVRMAVRESEKQPRPVGRNPNNKFPHFNLIRKAQCHSGWDWGICLPVSGLAGELYLQAVDNTRIEAVRHREVYLEDAVEVEVTADLVAERDGEVEVAAELAGVVQSRRIVLQRGENRVRFPFVIRNPRLWYPAGYGPQTLCELKVSTPDECVRRRIGFRKVEVIHEEDNAGWSMGFRVNGIELFAKGANWIPADAMPGRLTEADCRRLLEAAAACNMNMLRVWGGGIYESDLFYDLCDELGILVWQDFMFACARYPATPEFLAEVEAELRYQIRRLQSHPSLALWCGDNEVFMCLGNAKDRMEYAAWRVNFDRLSSRLAEVAAECDPDRMFWPSSPCNGPANMDEICHDMNRGDLHYWEVWHAGEPFSAYYGMRPRFCSEFGYQSFPSLRTIRRYAGEGGGNVTSPVMEHHQRHPGGNSRIVEMFTRYFRFPIGDEAVIYLSQLQQALAIKTAVEFWRTLKPHCRGTLYWQFNDNWPVASWSGIDYYGEWKQLQYHARRFYAPVMATAFRVPDGPLELHAVSDLAAGFHGTIEVVFLSFGGGVKNRLRFEIDLLPQEAKKIAELPEEEPTAGFYYLELSGEGRRHSNECFLTEYKRCELVRAGIHSRFFREGGKLLLELIADAPAFWVFCELTETRAVWSDNSLSLLPERAAVLECRPDRPLAPEEAAAQLRVTQLRDTWR